MSVRVIPPLLTPAKVNKVKGLRDVYIAMLPYCGFYNVLRELEKIYLCYLITHDVNTLRYLLALCLRSRHGNRQRWSVTAACVRVLVKVNIFAKASSCKDFEELHLLVKNSLSPYMKNAPLTIYDTALNIAYLVNEPQLCPQQYVYLSAGALEGAKNLVSGISYPMPFTCFSSYSLGLKNMEFEDFCCVFHNELQKIFMGTTVTLKEVVDKLCKSSRPYKPQSRSYVINRIKMGP